MTNFPTPAHSGKATQYTHSYKQLEQRDGKSTPSSLSEPALEEPSMNNQFKNENDSKCPKTKFGHL